MPDQTVLTAGLVTTPLTAAFAETDGSDGVASGNQIVVPVDAAIDACGNAVAVGGVSEAECVEVVEVLEEESANTPETLAGTDGSGGVASGNQIVVPVDAAVDICGNAVSVLGIAEAGCMETISEGGEDEGKDEEEGQEDDKDEGKDEEEGQEDDKDEGKDEEEGQEDDKDDDKSDDADSGKGDESDDKPAPSADGELPVTGGPVALVSAAALVLLGLGVGLFMVARRRRIRFMS